MRVLKTLPPAEGWGRERREDAEPRGEGLQEILYQAYDLRGFFRLANLLAIADLQIFKLANRWRQKKEKNCKFAIRNSQLWKSGTAYCPT